MTLSQSRGSKKIWTGGANTLGTGRRMQREMESDQPSYPPAACHLMCGNEPDGRDRQVAYAGWVQALNEWGGVINLTSVKIYIARFFDNTFKVVVEKSANNPTTSNFLVLQKIFQNFLNTANLNTSII
jgi:hypothetical protein